jgi:predicted DCC family thiol-disulfide oxidoreductase YuxK
MEPERPGDDGPVVLFDGVCNLCEGAVRFLVLRDPAGVFRFAPLQSEVGRRLLARHGLSPDSLDTFVLVEGDRARVHSDAFLGIARRLPAPWSWLRVLALLPRRLRDAVYGVVVRNRYRWFGRKEACLVPTPELRARFLADPPGRAAPGQAS